MTSDNPIQTLPWKNEQGTSTQRFPPGFRGFAKPLEVHPELQVKSQSHADQLQWTQLSGLWAKNMHALRVIHTGVPLCPQESVFVLVKASPARNYSSSSPPSCRTSLWPAPWPLRTLTSPPRRMEWARCPQHTRSASCPAEGIEGKGSKDSRAMKYPYLCRECPLTLHVLLIRETCYKPVSFPLLGCHLHAVSSPFMLKLF